MNIFKSSLAVLAGLLLYLLTLQRPYAMALVHKTVGGDQPCPWGELWPYPWQNEKLGRLRNSAVETIQAGEKDLKLGIQQFRTPTRPFWLKTDGGALDGQHLLAFIIAEQQWISEAQPGHGVRRGDVVVDVGAHVGTFGDDALRLGASKVVMVEPDPVNLECIRRNFKDEIASGRVVVIPEGAWSSDTTLEFAIGVANSGTGSLVNKEDNAQTIKIKVRPLDDMLRDAGIVKVDFIKMDIEGAERDALKGAAHTLKNSKPRLMLDMYHRSDDAVVLPRVILEANPAYHSLCAVCGMRSDSEDRRIIPYATFWE